MTPAARLRVALLLLLSGAVLGACVGELESAVEPFTYVEGGIIRGDETRRELALVFTGDEYADGGGHIRDVLGRHYVPATFFLTGRFYRNPEFASLIGGLREDGHYLGAHSDQHLLYCSWEDRDSLLVTRSEFVDDLEANYEAMERFGTTRSDAQFFMPPYEWYNRQISDWTRELGLTLVNFTPGTRSNADYTTPDMGERYVPSDVIFESILNFEQREPSGLNGFILLIHVGTAPERTDKFYHRLDELVTILRQRGYRFVRIDELLETLRP